MKTLHALSVIVVIYLVKEGACGAIDLESEVKGEPEVFLETKQGLFDKLMNTLINGYETATQILLDLLQKEDDEGFLSSLYDKLKEELSKLKDIILGGKPALGEEVDAARRAVERIIEEHKRIRANTKLILDGAIESVNNAKSAQKIVNEGPDLVRHRIFEIDHAIKNHVFDGARRPIDSKSNDVNHVEDTYKSSVDFLQEQGIKLTDAEKEMLDGISKRVRDSLMHGREK